MRRHLKYLSYVLRHKWFVLVECLRLGVPVWVALLHDWTKFLPGEWFPYARTFYAPDGTSQYVESRAFTVAWNHHQKRNRHHWQYWMITWDRGETECLPMPDICRREMLADWRGAGRALGKSDTAGWYMANRGKMKLHPETRAWIEEQLHIDVRERLACLCHEQWSGWMEYLFSKNTLNGDGSWTMPAELVDRWQRQMRTPYSALLEPEQISDRKEADKFIALLSKDGQH